MVLFWKETVLLLREIVLQISTVQILKHNQKHKLNMTNSDKTDADIMRLDIYGLDGNKNGIVCEALPAM